MATRLAASLPSPLKTKNASPTPTPYASFPLHCSIQFRHPKHHRQILSPQPHHWAPNGARGGFTFLAVFGRESVFTEEINNRETASDDDGDSGSKKRQTRPCELYVCNLPRSHDIAALVEMFKPYGTVISAEICRNPETGVSKGSGYITMGSVTSARTAISQLDGSVESCNYLHLNITFDVGGREMRIRFSAGVVSSGRKPDALTSGPTRFQFYESPHKVYVGNLPWSATP
ncbi:hypothetical protein Tsubulata_019157, partial [Turnera subulata]